MMRIADVELHSSSEVHTIEIARGLAAQLRPGDVIALRGPLGAGKTRFVRGLADGLGLDPTDVTSPTYVLCQEYGDPGGIRLAHLDGYRLTSPEDLETIGWDELLHADDTIIAVEWAERFGDELPERRIDVTIEHVDPHRRRITITQRGREGRGPAGDGEGACPRCGRPVGPGAETAPFCSPRCRMSDLGAWFDERYCISRPVRGDDEDL